VTSGAVSRAVLANSICLWALLLASCVADRHPASSRAIRRLTAGEGGIYRPPPGSESWLKHSVVLSIYGRGFGIAPILGRLGMDSSITAMHRQVQPYKAGVKGNDGGRRVIVAIHLIYGLAMPCSDSPGCLLYLDDTGVNIVNQYIKPALRMHWLVILDVQLGATSPEAAVARMIRRGYLRFDNVEVAIDPEFHLVPGYSTPGYPFGSVSAEDINRTMAMLGGYVWRRRLPHKKIFLVHQFQPQMIPERWRLRTHLHNVDLVINADGLGSPGLKAETYHSLIGPQIKHGVEFRGIKLFLPNPSAPSHYSDQPPMQWRQVFGHWPAVISGRRYWVHPAPSVVIIA